MTQDNSHQMIWYAEITLWAKWVWVCMQVTTSGD